MSKGANGFLVEYEGRPEGGRIARLTIDNETRLNSLNTALMQEIIERMTGVAADPELRLAILSDAGGRAFVGGADIAEIAGLDQASARWFITLVHRCCAAFRRLPVPVVARIDGFALGAGLELAAACDLRVASETSSFGMPEVAIGIPSVVEAALLPKLIGAGRARRLRSPARRSAPPRRSPGASSNSWRRPWRSTRRSIVWRDRSSQPDRTPFDCRNP
jgi:enoyl-CoA hydratase